MCYACWQWAGSPQINTERVRSAAALIADVFEFSFVGGNLHLQIYDENLEDDFFEDDELQIPEDDDLAEGETPEVAARRHQAERACYLALKTLTVDERYSAMGMYAGYWTPGNIEASTGGEI